MQQNELPQRIRFPRLLVTLSEINKHFYKITTSRVGKRQQERGSVDQALKYFTYKTGFPPVTPRHITHKNVTGEGTGGRAMEQKEKLREHRRVYKKLNIRPKETVILKYPK